MKKKFLFLPFFSFFFFLHTACAEEAAPPIEQDSLPQAAIGKEFPEPSTSAPKRKLWFRNSGEWVASRTVRAGVSTEPTGIIITDGKRFDTTVGKRFPVFTWKEKSMSESWSIGIDGGMLASLVRYNNLGNLAFGTNTFDGFFGAYFAYANDGSIFLFRTAHLSAHLVDNSPDILTPISYSQFWNEIILGQNFPAPEEESDWDLYLQTSIGLNNTSAPASNNPRLAFGISAGKALSGPDSLAIIASGDILNTGVQNQRSSYSAFLGLGRLQRPNTTHRPYRFGVVTLQGTDQRNQYYTRRQNFTAFELQAEF